MDVVDAAPRAPVHELLTYAGRAPSVHNTQPWFWCIDGERVTLFADYEKQLKYADPDGRDLVLSCGAALHHLGIAAAAVGWEAKIHRMPNPANNAQLADVTFVPGPSTAQARQELDVLLRRRTDRRRTASWPVGRGQVARLLGAAVRSRAQAVAVVSAPARALLLNLQDAADAAQRRDPDYLDEVETWVERPDDQGIPFANLVRHPPAVGDRGAGTRFLSGTLADAYPSEEPPCAALLVICSASDDIASRLRAGEALSAVLLQSTRDGLASMTLSQAVEVDQTREILQDELLRHAAFPQVLVRVGWPEDGLEPLPPTPRHAIDHLISDPADLPARFGPYRGHHN
jgi:hypothetical protein